MGTSDLVTQISAPINLGTEVWVLRSRYRESGYRVSRSEIWGPRSGCPDLDTKSLGTENRATEVWVPRTASPDLGTKNLCTENLGTEIWVPKPGYPHLGTESLGAENLGTEIWVARFG